MSVAIALIGKDGIVLATDSRMTSLDRAGQLRTHDDSYVKLWRISNSAAIAAVGSVAGYENELVEGFQKQVENTWDFAQIVDKFTEYVRTKWSEAIAHTDPQILLSTSTIIEFIIVGYEGNSPRIKRVYWERTEQVIVPRSIEVECGYHVAGIAYIADYWLRKIEGHLPSMSIEQLEAVATMLIHESKYFDAIGGNIQMASIQKDVGAKMMPKDELIQLETRAGRVTNSNTASLVKKLG
jgi:20S proteasome alpha/beta subunit